jgi:hypothetical protein
MLLKNRAWRLAGFVACISAICLTEGAAAQSSPQQKPRDRGLAAIVDSGSTNTNRFRILVDRSGKTQFVTVPHGRPIQPAEPPETAMGTIPAALASRLYADLDAAWPISSLPAPHCAKSASFGTTLTIEFDSQQTPDLNCGDGKNPKLRALIEDAKQIVSASQKPTARHPIVP